MGLLDKLKKSSPTKQISPTNLNAPKHRFQASRIRSESNTRPSTRGQTSTSSREIGPGHLRTSYSGTWPLEDNRMSRRDMFEAQGSSDSLPEELRKYLTMPVDEPASGKSSKHSGTSGATDSPPSSVSPPQRKNGKERPNGILRRFSSVIKLPHKAPPHKNCRSVVEGMRGEVPRTHR